MKSISEIMQHAAGMGSGKIAVAAAHDDAVIQAVCEARRQGIAQSVLVGDGEKIRAMLAELGEDAANYEIVDAADDVECAEKAVACVVEGRAGFLMKGLLGTATLMRAVLNKEHGLRTGRLISHVMLYEPRGHKMMALTDGGMNTFPDLEKKAGILENAAIVMKALGYETINTACICGAEVVDPKIPSMVEAQALTEMTERWAPYNMNVYGPVGLDLAVSKEACHHKKYTAVGGGEADILLVPTYEVGNGIGKAMSLFGETKNAGIIVGAKVPIVLVSRSDSAETKLASIALGAVVAANA